MSSEETERGLVLIPLVRHVTIETNYLTGLEFSQFTSTITGTVTCIGNQLNIMFFVLAITVLYSWMSTNGNRTAENKRFC